jgi:hypothetical protein
MTTQQEAWDKVHAAVAKADSIAWDGCHKIYVLMDEGQTEEMRSYGYGEDDGEDGLCLVGDQPESAFLRLRRWWDESCGLRFVSAVSSPGRNENFEQLIAQFDEEEWEE